MTIRNYFSTSGAEGFRQLFIKIRNDLVEAEPYDVGEWQSQKIEHKMREIFNVVFAYNLPNDPKELARQTGASMPWAEDHFQERVSRVPMNPAPSEEWWPFAKNMNRDHKSEEGGKFSHTYPERIWPRMAEVTNASQTPNRGIRFEYGDLDDVIDLLHRQPNTRQAYLPLWFPEDTGAHHGKRVPCTLGYHFTIREGVLNITYFMRSTDLLRHFRDDIYMAGRLAQWVRDQLNAREPYASDWSANQLGVGELIFHTANMHIFDADLPLIEFWKSQGKAWNE